MKWVLGFKGFRFKGGRMLNPYIPNLNLKKPAHPIIPASP